MFITIKDVVGEKTILIPGSIPPGKKIAIVEILNNSLVCKVENDIVDENFKVITLPRGDYMSKRIRELLLNPKDYETWNGLGTVTELNYCVSELKTEENSIDGEPSDILHTYLVSQATQKTEVMRFEPKRLKFKRLANKTITKLTVRVTDQEVELVRDGLTTTIILQIV